MAEFDELKGRAKEAAGDLTGDEDLKREGKIDQTTGKVKALVGRASDKIKGVLRRD
ncbi:MAG: CsbD family protein [Actinomycetota bacterium]|nr:CsbD family protein [Actinomycetota bacterium]